MFFLQHGVQLKGSLILTMLYKARLGWEFFYHFLNVSFYLCWSEEILRKAASILVNKCHGRFISRIYHKRLTSYDQGDRLLPPLPDGGRRIVSVHILHAPDNLHPSDNVL